jgi:hypothetical protein
MTKGIVASNFLDAGVKRIAREFPLVYQEMYAELYADKAARRQISARAGVTAPRPTVDLSRVRTRAFGR